MPLQSNVISRQSPKQYDNNLQKPKQATPKNHQNNRRKHASYTSGTSQSKKPNHLCSKRSN